MTKSQFPNNTQIPIIKHEQAGLLRPKSGGMGAATASLNNLTLVTINVAHFPMDDIELHRWAKES